MAGKGSGRRPTQVDNDTFTSNWAKAFTPKDPYEEENPIERVGMWTHHCPAQGVPICTISGAGCNWCDATEYK